MARCIRRDICSLLGGNNMAEQMATAINGANKVLFARRLSDEKNMDGTRISLQTTHSIEISSDDNTTETKDGNITVAGNPEVELSLEFLGSNDPVVELLEDASMNHDVFEFWEVNFEKPDTGGKYPAKYMQAVVTKFSSDSDADDFNKVKVELKVNGQPKKGSATVDKKTIGDLQYAFKDIPKATTPAK